MPLRAFACRCLSGEVYRAKTSGHGAGSAFRGYTEYNEWDRNRSPFTLPSRITGPEL